MKHHPASHLSGNTSNENSVTVKGECANCSSQRHTAVVLEGQSSRQFNCSRLIHLGCPHNSKCRGSRVGVRHVEPRMTEGVESVHPQLEGHTLRGLEVLVDSNIRSEEHTSELQSRGHLVC